MPAAGAEVAQAFAKENMHGYFGAPHLLKALLHKANWKKNSGNWIMMCITWMIGWMQD